jgi:hypothetical protein
VKTPSFVVSIFGLYLPLTIGGAFLKPSGAFTFVEVPFSSSSYASLIFSIGFNFITAGA